MVGYKSKRPHSVSVLSAENRKQLKNLMWHSAVDAHQRQGLMCCPFLMWCFSAQRGCRVCLFELLQTSCQLEAICSFFSDLSYQQGVLFCKLSAHRMDFYCFHSNLSKRSAVTEIDNGTQIWYHDIMIISHGDHMFFPFWYLMRTLSKTIDLY